MGKRSSQPEASGQHAAFVDETDRESSSSNIRPACAAVARVIIQRADLAPVGWRERDWAKWTDAERQRFYGTTRSTSRPTPSPSRPPVRSSPQIRGKRRTQLRLQVGGKRRMRKETVAAFILIAAVVTYSSGVLNRVRQNPSSPPSSGPASTRSLRLPQVSPTTTTTSSIPRHTTMSGPSSVRQGAHMTITGTLPPDEGGLIVVEGQWESGPWYELASTSTSSGNFKVRYALPRPGVVHVRLVFPNGTYAVHTIDVT